MLYVFNTMFLPGIVFVPGVDMILTLVLLSMVYNVNGRCSSNYSHY